MSLTLLASLTVVLVIAAVILVRPWLGLPLLALGGAAGKLADLPELGWDLVDVIGAATGWAALLYVMAYGRRYILSPLDGPVLLIAVAVLISLARSGGGPELLSGFRFLALLLIYFLGVLVLDTPQKVRATLVAVLAASGLASAFSLFLFLSGVRSFSVGGTSLRLAEGGLADLRVGGTFEQPNVFAQLMAIGVPLGLALTLMARGHKRWLLGGLTSASLICALLTLSRSAILGLVLGSLIVVYVSREKRRWRVSAALALVLLAFTIATSVGALDRLLLRVGEKGLAAEYQTRTAINRRGVFQAALHSLWEHPLGVGYGQGHRAIGARLGVRSRSAHNMLLSWGVDLGVLGLLAGIWFLVRQVSTLWRVVRTSHGGEERLLAAGCLGSVVATWVHNMFHTALYLTFVWVFFSAASALVLLRSRSSLKTPQVMAPQTAALPHPLHARTILPS